MSLIKFYSKVFVITGTKIDLRENKETIGSLTAQGLSPVKREQGIKLANKIRAVKYMECSALTQRGLKQVSHWIYLPVFCLINCLVSTLLLETLNYYNIVNHANLNDYNIVDSANLNDYKIVDS